jgi:hypothetical protein
LLIPDANVMLHAVNRRARDHAHAREWLLAALRGREPVGLAWNVLLAFVRISTNPSAFSPPISSEQAIAMVERWLSAPVAIVVEPTRRHPGLLGGLLGQTGTASNLVSDAHLAALALEHDATVVSFDRDFGQFEGLRWRLPA